VTTIVTALISGTIGGYIDDFFARAKPSISLLSVGFQAPSQTDSVRLPDEVSAMSKQAHWSVGLERFESFSRVLELEQLNRGWIQEANELITSLQEWKSKYIGRTNSTYPLTETLPASAILNHPYFSSDVGGTVITVLLRRGLMGKVTYSEKEIETAHSIMDAADQKDQQRWIFFLSYKGQLLPYKDTSEFQTHTIGLFAHSFTRGITQNVLEFTDYAISLTRKDILDAQRISAAMQDATLPNATIATTIALINTGKSPVTFSPYFGIKIDHPDYYSTNMVLVAVDSAKKENPFALTSGGFTINLGDREKKGERVRVDPFLPNTESTKYLTILGGETLRAKLLGVSALGTKAKPLVDMHATKLLKARIIGNTLNRNTIWSDWTPFSLQVDESVKKQLETAVP